MNTERQFYKIFRQPVVLNDAIPYELERVRRSRFREFTTLLEE
jgi:hypothetical protein